MSDQTTTGLWIKRLTFLGLVLLIIFFRLLPLQTTAGGWIWPDFVLCLALAWSVRRPEYVPAVLLAAAFLLADLLLQRPPGLWALLALVACEKIKGQSRSLRDATLLSEIVTISIWIIGISVAYRVILGVLLVDTPAFGPSVKHILVTLVAYPVVVAITHLTLGVRKAAPNELGSKGVRS